MPRKSLTLDQLKIQKIINDPNDLVADTWLKGHPSLGESDEVVWLYGLVRCEFAKIIRKNKKIPLKSITKSDNSTRNTFSCVAGF